MAAQHLPQNLVRPSSSLKNWRKRRRPSSHCVPAQKFVPKSGKVKSRLFIVGVTLRQECVISLLLFIVYMNSINSQRELTRVCVVTNPLHSVYELDRQSEGTQTRMCDVPNPLHSLPKMDRQSEGIRRGCVLTFLFFLLNFETF